MQLLLPLLPLPALPLLAVRLAVLLQLLLPHSLRG
jgi:hypothetical protein